MNDGYIKLGRSFFDHWLWDDGHELTRSEAWLAMIAQARFSEGEQKRIVNGKLVRWGKGEMLGSVRFLKELFRWKSNTKVTNFLDLLVSDGMIKIQKGQGISIIQLVNYERFNAQKEDQEKTGKDTDKDGQRTDRGQGEDGVRTPRGRGEDNTKKEIREEKGDKEEKEKKETNSIFSNEKIKSNKPPKNSPPKEPDQQAYTEAVKLWNDHHLKVADHAIQWDKATGAKEGQALKKILKRILEITDRAERQEAKT
ncbi:MAG: hypothetical protein E4H32_04375 [Nitrospirales bacterium]|nr:MAG: hypothetical protein E4H32_04375 [Nitrospirales bacterium]